jgi:hypothetical protein
MKSGPRSAKNENQAGTHPDARTTDPSKAGQPGSVAVAPQPINPVEEMRGNHADLVEES